MTRIAKLSRPDRMWTVYAAYGKAMMSAHSLESQIAALLLTRASMAPGTKVQFQATRMKLDKLTLGPLIERFVVEFKPSEDLSRGLEALLPVRNELAHRVSTRILLAAREVRWEEGVVSDLLRITESFLEAKSRIQPFADDWFAEMGVEYEQLLEAELAKHPGVRGAA